MHSFSLNGVKSSFFLLWWLGLWLSGLRSSWPDTWFLLSLYFLENKFSHPLARGWLSPLRTWRAKCLRKKTSRGPTWAPNSCFQQGWDRADTQKVMIELTSRKWCTRSHPQPQENCPAQSDTWQLAATQWWTWKWHGGTIKVVSFVYSSFRLSWVSEQDE